ncbi:MAG: DUF882 domain-containing protein [Pseudomonadota bacterium]
MRRRNLLTCLGGAALLTAAPLSLAGAATGTRTLSFFNTHTDEQVTARYRVDGVLDKGAKADIDYILRDWRAGAVAEMDPNLLDLLVQVQNATGVEGPLHIISGYRTANTNSMLRKNGGGGVAKKSYHVRAQAIDVRLPGCKLKYLRKCALDVAGGGVGYYPGPNFVHLDTGPVRRW